MIADTLRPAARSRGDAKRAFARRVYSVLGLPIEVAAYSPQIDEAARRSLGHAVGCDTGPACRLCLVPYEPAGGAEPGRLIPHVQARSASLLIRAGCSFGLADRRHSVALAFLSPALLVDSELASYGFIETLALFLASARRPATLHAAAVSIAGRCVLITGERGAGKSTMAYACAASGFEVLGDDVVHATETERAVQAWATPGRIYLTPNSRELFLELRGVRMIRRLSGEMKLAVDMPVFQPAIVQHGLPVYATVSLRRSPCMSSMGEGDADAIYRGLTSLPGVPCLDQCAIDSAARRLARGRIGTLEAGDPCEAAQVLRQWVESL